MSENSQLDCVVRFHAIERLPELQRCVFSLVGQSYRPLHIILTVQRFSSQQIEQTRQALEPLLSGSHAPSLEICNWTQDEPTDGRAFLLNVGIGAASGRYLAFLDYDDTLYPEAYQLLVSSLRQNNVAISFATVQLLRLQVYTDFFYTLEPVTPKPFCGENLLDLFQNNFCPLHSYVLDRQQIAPEQLQIDPYLTIEEDYDFLLRICAEYPADFTLIKTVIGCYYFKTDESNTVANINLDKKTTQLYQQVCSRIEQRRRSTLVSPEVQQLIGASPPVQPCSIRQLLDILVAGDAGIEIQDSCGAMCRWLRAMLWPGRLLSHTVKRGGNLRGALGKVWTIFRYEGVMGIRLRLRRFSQEQNNHRY